MEVNERQRSMFDVIHVIMNVCWATNRNEAIVKSSVETADYYDHSYASLIVMSVVPCWKLLPFVPFALLAVTRLWTLNASGCIGWTEPPVLWPKLSAPLYVHCGAHLIQRSKPRDFLSRSITWRQRRQRLVIVFLLYLSPNQHHRLVQDLHNTYQASRRRIPQKPSSCNTCHKFLVCVPSTKEQRIYYMFFLSYILTQKNLVSIKHKAFVINYSINFAIKAQRCALC